MYSICKRSLLIGGTTKKKKEKKRNLKSGKRLGVRGKRLTAVELELRSRQLSTAYDLKHLNMTTQL